MLPVMNYAVYTDIASRSLFIDRLSAFAVSCGWVLREKQNDIKWVDLGEGAYGWDTDTNNLFPAQYLEIENSSTQFRIYPMPDNNAAHELSTMHISGFDSGTNYSNTSSSPAYQTNMRRFDTRTLYEPLPTGQMFKVYFFGTSEFLAWILQLDYEFFVMTSIGKIQTWSTSSDYAWIGKAFDGDSSLGGQEATVRYTIASAKTDNYYKHCSFLVVPTYEGLYYTTEKFTYPQLNHYKRLLVYQRANSKRTYTQYNWNGLHYTFYMNENFSQSPIYIVNFFYKDTDSVWFAAGYSPLGFIYKPGNTPPGIINVGLQKYFVIPRHNIFDANYHYAFRIS